MITEAVIKKQTGQYDMEVVERLKLDGQGIKSISGLDGCVNLIDLNLSNNEITSMTGLEKNINMKRLDLSNNKIKELCNLEHMAALEHLDLRGNEVSSFDELDKLRACYSLKSLSFRNCDGAEANPICQHPSYTTIVLRALPQLNILDGGHITILDATSALEAFVASVKPDPALSAPLPVEPWWTPEESSVDSSAAGIENDLNNGAFRSAMEAHDKVLEILREDTAHLLRKAQSSVLKAQKESMP